MPDDSMSEKNEDDDEEEVSSCVSNKIAIYWAVYVC